MNGSSSSTARSEREFDPRPVTDALVAPSTVVYEVILHIFGLRSYLPYLLADWLVHFVCVALLYHIVARRSGTVLGSWPVSLSCFSQCLRDLFLPSRCCFFSLAPAACSRSIVC